ncbi:MAG TPA: PAS domain S-box protein, partial [Candidatus Aminicenantes bacterium]|nr:PAS domain S-box protein [Candidatus Aminicenantes bacterium]
MCIRDRVKPERLLKIANEYTPRPEYILNAAKNHILAAAETISNIFMRKQAEEALEDSEQWLSTTLRSIGDAVIATDIESFVTLMNPVAEDLTGYSEAEASGKPLKDVFNIINEQTGERAEDPIARVLREGVVVGLANNTVLIAKDGTKRPIADSGAPIRDEEGNIIGMVMVFRDTTELKKAEEKLRFSDAAFRSIQESVIATDIEYTVTHWNEVSERLYGIKASESIGKKLFDVIEIAEASPGENAERFKMLETQGYYQDEVLHRTECGEVWVSVSVQEIKNGGKRCGWVALATDITERKRAEEALQESEEKYRALVESATDMIFMIDKNNKVLSTNKAAARLFGKGSKEIIGKSILNLFPEKIASRFSKNLKKVFETGRPGFHESNMIVGERESWISVNLSPVRYPDGRIMAVMGVTRDITERKKAEEQVKASLKEKEVLLKEIHHRVKNNMQVISSLLKLQSQYIKDKRYADIFKESQDRIKSMSLIHELLYQSKHLSKINFKEYIKILTNYLFRSCWPFPHKIALKIESENVYLAIDNAIPCGLIIHELVSNSLKHAFSGSKEGEIKIALHSINERDIELVVSDDGVGMPEDLDFRNTKSLGLHLVTILAEDQLQGEIKLGRNKGTEFQIKLRDVR